MRENYTIKNLRTINFSLSIPYFCNSQPDKVNIISNKKEDEVEIKVAYNFTVWDNKEIEGNISTNKLTEKLKEIIGFDFEFDGIYTIDDIALIQEERDMDKYIQDIYFKKVPKETENNILLEKIGIKNIMNLVIYI